MVAIHATSGNDVFSVGRWALNESENRVPSFVRQPGNSYLLAMAFEPQVSNVGVRNEATFYVPRPAMLYRCRQESGDAVREALIGACALTTHIKLLH